jgi:acyl-CoA synthetase (AMP-forming)/AMP-acid ligase II
VSAGPAGAGVDWSHAGWRAHLPSVQDVRGYAASLGEATLTGLAAAAAARDPGHPAVVIEGQRVSHGGLDAAAAGVARWLAGRLGPGDRVLLAAAASPAFLRCYLGALRAGAVVVLANPGYTTAEFAHLAADSAAVLALADPGPAQALAALPSPLPTVDVRAVPHRSPAGDGQVRAGPDDVALLAYTSGTTGRPKGVPLTHRQLVASASAAMAAWRWHPGDVAVHALPLFHQHGLGAVHMTLAAGSTLHVRARFSPADLAGAVRAAGASVLFGVPTMYRALLDAAAAGSGVPSVAGLRLAVCGSAPLSPDLAARLPAVLGRLPLVRYGTTESGLDVSHVLGGTRPGTVGVPLPGVLARIWDTAGGQAALGGGQAGPGREAPAGTDGEIQLRGPQVFDGYWRDEAATRAAFTGGWFRTGDIGRVDPVTGQLEIRGRLKEMIITGGLNVYPREVEQVLETHPCVAEAAVAGVPHERWGEQVTAWVVVRPGWEFDEARLIAHARGSLAGYKCPKRVLPVPALPRNHVGKVIRAALARHWADSR